MKTGDLGEADGRRSEDRIDLDADASEMLV